MPKNVTFFILVKMAIFAPGVNDYCTEFSIFVRATVIHDTTQVDEKNSTNPMFGVDVESCPYTTVC